MENHSKLNTHLLWRSGFGPKASDAGSIQTLTRQQLWAEIKQRSEAFAPIDIVSQSIDYNDFKDAGPEKRKELQQKSRKANISINLAWLELMTKSEGQLREKMAFFWHGHFATRIINARHNENLLNTIRKHALGSFRDLLFEVSKSAAMLSFLNNQQNKKGHPNENFAREVMELFTMGHGHYSEQDIRESARAFTGWAFDKEGNFIFREKQHDTGTKTFLGRSGNFNGDDILNILLEQQATAEFITRKIYRLLVNEKPDEAIISKLSNAFFRSGYSISDLLDQIFTSEWFYNKANIGSKIKSPIELLAGIQRLLPVTFEKNESQIIFQRLLGQMLLYPPNVAGWPGGTSWIDSSTLMLRLKIPQIISGIRPLDYTPKEDDDINMGNNMDRLRKQMFKNQTVAVNWTAVKKYLENVDLLDFLLQNEGNLRKNIFKSIQPQDLEANIIAIMSTPEYQLM